MLDFHESVVLDYLFKETIQFPASKQCERSSYELNQSHDLIHHDWRGPSVSPSRLCDTPPNRPVRLKTGQ